MMSSMFMFMYLLTADKAKKYGHRVDVYCHLYDTTIYDTTQTEGGGRGWRPGGQGAWGGDRGI